MNTLRTLVERLSRGKSGEIRALSASLLLAAETVDRKQPVGLIRKVWINDLFWLVDPTGTAKEICEVLGLSYEDLQREALETGLKKLRKADMWEVADAVLHRSGRTEGRKASSSR